MIEVYKPTQIALPHIDAIKGHTIIELKDAKTGKRERIESDNLVTDGAEYLLRMMPQFGGGLGGAGMSLPWFAVLFGGIYLFDTAVPTSPTPAKFMPAGTKMVGNGSYRVANSGEVTEMGSYNVSESSATTTRVVQVYDFSTQQANGNIASVCLGNNAGAYVGYGNSSSGVVHATTKDAGEDFGYGQVENGGYDVSMWHNNKVYHISSVFNGESTSLTVVVSNCPVSEVLSLNGTCNNASEIEDTIVFDNVTPMGGNPGWVACNAKLVAIMSDCPANVTISVRVFDVDTGVVDEYNIPNNTGERIVHIGRCASSDGTASLCYGATTQKVYVLDFVNERIIDSNCTMPAVPTTMGGMRITEDLYVIDLTGRGQNIFDPVNKTFYPINGGVIVNDAISNYQDADGFSFRCSSGYYHNMAVYKNAMRLTTINNLPNVIQKTAAQTMKVTYTLTMA